jgi:hypothetical protein
MRASPCGRSVVAEPLRVPIQIVLSQFQRHAAPHPLQRALWRDSGDGFVEKIHSVRHRIVRSGLDARQAAFWEKRNDPQMERSRGSRNHSCRGSVVPMTHS